MVHLARGGGLVAPARPLAVPVAQEHGVADPGRDGLGVPDVQRQARAGQAGAELPPAQERGQPARAGQQVDSRADDGPLQRLPGRAGARAGVRAGPAAGVRVRGGAGAVAGPVELAELGAQPDQVLQRGDVDVPGHDRGHRRVARDAFGGVAV